MPALVAGRPSNAVARQQVPDVASAGPSGRKAVPEQRRNENHRPLHPLGLVDGHDPDRVRVGVLVVLPALRIGVLGVVLEEVRE